MYITYFNRNNNPNPYKTDNLGIEGLIKEIKGSDKKAGRTLLKLKKEGSPTDYSEAKKACFSFSIGKWSYRKADRNVVYENYFMFDVDKITDKIELDNYIKILKEIDYVDFVAPSVSWQGLRIGIKTENGTFERHKQNYDFVAHVLCGDAGINIDPSCKSVERHFYFAFVPDTYIYHNPKSRNFILPVKETDNTIFTAAPKLGEKIDFILKGKVFFVEGNRAHYTYRWMCIASENGFVLSDSIAYFLEKYGNFDNGAVERTAEDAYKKTVFNSYKPQKDIPTTESPIVQTLENSIFENESPIVQSLENSIIENESPIVQTLENPIIEKESAIAKKETVPENTYIRLAMGDSMYALQINWLLKNFDFRRNIVTYQVECRKKGTQDEYLPVRDSNLSSDLLEAGYKAVSENVGTFLASDRFFLEYDPFTDYFKNLPIWDGKDTIKELCKYVKMEAGGLNFEVHLKKALCRSIAQIFGTIDFNKNCLTLQGKSNDGKTSFIRWLNPFGKKYHLDRFEVTQKEDDYNRRLGSCFFINIDEIAGYTADKMKKLKAKMTYDSVIVRFVFDKYDSTVQRKATFWATTEEDDFLDNSSGNVRFVVFKVKSIQHDRGHSKGYSKNIDLQQLWAQAYHLYNTNDSQYYVLSDDEVLESEANNKGFMPESTEQELLKKHFVAGDTEMTSTDLKFYLEKRYKEYKYSTSTVAIGKAMSSIGFKKQGKGNGAYKLSEILVNSDTGEVTYCSIEKVF